MSAPEEEGFDGRTTPACIVAEGDGDPLLGTLEDTIGSASVTAAGEGCLRRFSIASTAPRRDNPQDSPRTVEERDDITSLQTRNVLFDALYQLAWTEARELSVSQIQDGAFHHGQALVCPGGCFETGEKWKYVWTRDTAYAAHLGLGWIDASRARASLEMKLSPRRDGSDLQIVQDTGTGGSYPVSSDRVVWALGAAEILSHLTGEERAGFRDRALSALSNTIEHDRAVVFDPQDGLYRGEQSFLDWRSQSYPGWTVPDTQHIAMSKSLSTNVAHLAALVTAAQLAEERADSVRAAKFREYAEALRMRIRERFWLPEEKQFSSFITTALDPAPARRFDLLGTSLAILFDVATPEQARDAIATYPVLAKGPPVLFPAQKDTAIYHNRAMWPFVTAYGLRAAKKAKNARFVEQGVRSLLRGAALHLSNMENLELVTGKAWVDDGAWSGPVVNSRRQLWSVAGYIGAVHGVLFGLEATPRGLRVEPFLPRALRAELFPTAKTLVLNNVRVRNKLATVVLRLPPLAKEEGGAYGIGRVRLNGRTALDGHIDQTAMTARNWIEVDMTDASSPLGDMRVVDGAGDARDLFGPRTPTLDVTASGAKLAVNIGLSGEPSQDVTITVYRDGQAVAAGLPGTTASWADPNTTGASSPSHCYTVETRYIASGNTSQRANPVCYWGASGERILRIDASNMDGVGGTTRTANGRTFRGDWGDVGHTLGATFTASRDGEHLVEILYANGAGSIETGITCGVKRGEIRDHETGALVGSGYVTMPQRGSWTSWGSSSFVRATLAAGKVYRVTLLDDARSVNMSAFEHFTAYTGGTGGASGPFFRVDVAELKILSLAP